MEGMKISNKPTTLEITIKNIETGEVYAQLTTSKVICFAIGQTAEGKTGELNNVCGSMLDTAALFARIMQQMKSMLPTPLLEATIAAVGKIESKEKQA